MYLNSVDPQFVGSENSSDGRLFEAVKENDVTTG